MTDDELDSFYAQTLHDILADTKDARESITKYTLPEYAEIIEDFDAIIEDLEFLIKETATIDDLAEMDDDLIDNFYEYLFSYMSNFCIDENPVNKEKDQSQYEKLQELIFLFTDDEDEE